MNSESNCQIEITYYTDPLCCWSWAFEPQWRKLRYEYEGLIKWKYCMSGMIQDWDVYNDPVNMVSRPQQMGPVWREASIISGMPIKDSIWIEDPPGSSFPSCLAVKCAELQSHQAGEWFLRKAREAVMLEGRNIAKKDVLLEIATTLHNAGILNLEQFKKDINGEEGFNWLKQDLQSVNFLKVKRFPSFYIRHISKSEGIFIVGFRPYDAFINIISEILPDVNRYKKKVLDVNEFQKFWKGTSLKEEQKIVNEL